MTTTRARPGTLSSSTTKLHTEHGNLYVTVSLDEDGAASQSVVTVTKETAV